MVAEVEFRELAAQPRTVSIPLSHLSIEIGHLYAEDFGPGYVNIHRHFERVAPWVHQARAACAAQLPKHVRPRISTCFLVDDYRNTIPNPAEVIEQLRKAAEAYDLTIDYVARESGCVEAEGVPLARLVADRLVSDPPPQTTGGRPPVAESGWLCNGQRTPGTAPAMAAGPQWSPPHENGPKGHSIFVDVELWSHEKGEQVWSCAYLASVWQLVRLGLLRHHGEAAVRPYRLDDDDPLPQDWSRLPTVVQLNPKAAPFSAYRTMSILRSQFLPVELAVRTILSQVSVEGSVREELTDRSAHEGVAVPDQVVQRISYAFVNDA
ncbi:SCO2522 family protein [Dactylosporangium sp. NPDC049140]|uniref:SCO2522 family protein n=1 Tax=Dactylosporangium sp. NPDC049140 TaxID=3155647 RepID=UPI0033E75932